MIPNGINDNIIISCTSYSGVYQDEEKSESNIKRRINMFWGWNQENN